MRDANDRGAGAIIAAGFVGAGTCGLQLVGLLFVQEPNDPASLMAAGPAYAILGFIVALIPFSLGVWMVGLPAWMILHRVGWTSRLHALLSGAVLAGAAGAILSALTGGSPIEAGAFLLLPGAIAGWTLHRIAYGKAGPSPA